MEPRQISDNPVLAKNVRVRSHLLWGVVPRLIGLLDETGDRVPLMLFVLAAAVLMVMSAVLSRGGYVHPELGRYLSHYLSAKPLAAKVFDFQNVEILRTYRPRPLSYLTDNIDVSFIAWSFRHGFPHLLSVSYFVFWAVEWVLLWMFFHSYLHLTRAVSGLLLCLLSTGPVMALNAAYFRSAKPGATFLLLVSFVVFAGFFRSMLSGSSWLSRFLWAASGAVLLFSACLFDEIPAAFGVAGALMLILECWLSRGSKMAFAAAYCLIPIGVAIAAYAFYGFAIHPELVRHFSGQTVTMSYQAGLLAALFQQPVLTLYGALMNFADTFGFLVGCISAVLAAVLLAALASAWGNSAWSGLTSRRKALVRITAGGLLMIGCLYGMIAQHPLVMWVDFRRTVYALPLTMVFLVFLASSLALLLRIGYLSRGQVQLALLVLIASNIVSLPAERRIIESQLMHRVEFTRLLFTNLHSPFASSSGALSPSQLADLQKEVADSQVYQLLEKLKADR